MTDSQSNKLDMFLVVNDFHAEFQVILDAVAARATAFTQLKTNIDLINKEVGLQSTNTTGVALDKSALRDTLDEITATTLASAKAWAKAVGNNTLAAEFDYSISDIQRIKDDTMQGFCDYRIGLVNDNLVAMADYGIDATTVTAWQDALNAYTPALESPRQAINSRVLHTQNLKNLFADTAKLFTEQLDPLMLVFKSTDPSLYSGYKQARIVINRTGGGSGTTSPTTINITGNVSDTDTTAPINNASVVFSSPAIPDAILANTDSNGNYSMSITGLTAGATISGNFEVSATSYNLASNPVDVTAGKNYTFDFTLTPEVP
jgi:hypothetical protein